jgi:hypothetical protein
MTISAQPASPPVAAKTGLRANVLGLSDSIVMAVAGSAPVHMTFLRIGMAKSPARHAARFLGSWGALGR